ncbi:PREDICTED: uncharacterized protein LOC107170885 [Diuraphis noxia]|uniref:uncharacterized protein LOC107170885 n=1 Tax=Diuraphis noxia TaxID=143948 RepID=UPI00076360D0|nr:PREDICTED: uncharacterized protein LOC107170885 [Diuraphis noxia]
MSRCVTIQSKAMMYSNTSNDELEPRSAPKPTQFQELSAKPEVPELSVVFDSSENISKPLNRNPSYYANSQKSHETYNEWKNRQNRSPPVHKETHYYESRDKQYYGSSSYSDCDQNPYSRFSDKISYKAGSDYHKCACQNTPTVKDIYSMMQLQNDQMKLLLETIQKLLVTVLSNQQNQHKCYCCDNGHCKIENDSKTTEVFKNDVTQKECTSQHTSNENTEKPQAYLKKTETIKKKNESNKNLKCSGKPEVTSITKEKPKNPVNTGSDNSNDEKENNKEKERTYSIISDESFDLNANDVQVIEDPISPEQSIHIDMKSSSEDSENINLNKHFVPTTQPTMPTKSPNNYSISTLHYMERYHLIAPENTYTSENPHQTFPTEGLLNKKKKSLRKNKTPSKILNITELKQQPKLS